MKQNSKRIICLKLLFKGINNKGKEDYYVKSKSRI